MVSHTGCFGLGGRWSHGPELQKPVGANVIGEIEQVRMIAPELMADTNAKTHPFLLQFFEQTRPVAQFDQWRGSLTCRQPVTDGDRRADRRRDTRASRRSSLAPADTEAIAQAVELFRD